MTPVTSGLLPRAATSIYIVALRAFPRRHRDVYAAEMIDTFQRELAAREHRSGTWRALAFAAAACLDAVSAGVGERRRQRQRGQLERWRSADAQDERQQRPQRRGLAVIAGSAAISWIDIVLAWRMLVRYPGLTLVGVFGMTAGIAIAAGSLTVGAALMESTVPLPEGDRIVSLLNWDASTNNRELRLLHDFAAWRELKSVEDIGITRNVEHNLIVEGAAPETVTVAEISASAFRVARVAPLLGRYLLPEDERTNAPDAIVIGHDEWRRRFSADPLIVGRSVHLGSTRYTIVGVMPEGFAFPVNHGFWIPSHVDPSAFEPRTGPAVHVFARLAPGVTLERVQAELAPIGQRASSASPATHEHLRARVLPYTYAYNDMDDPDNARALRAIQTAIVLLLVVICVNVAILVYARTATRQSEIAVRGALGASRGRIVVQLFVEALMLAAVAAALGISLLSAALRDLDAALLPMVGRMPFWMTFRLSANDAISVVALTLLAAAIVGVAPALKATGRGVHTPLQRLSAGSGSHMQMGRLWTTLIVAQVGLTVALLPAAMFHAWSALRFRTGDAGYASRSFLTTRLSLERESTRPPTASDEPEFQVRYASVYTELERRLRGEAAVRDVTFSMTGAGEEWAVIVEAEGVPAPIDPVNYNIVEGTRRGHLARFNRVAVNFFEAFDVPVVMGRSFQAADVDVSQGPGVTTAAAATAGTATAGMRAVLVNRAMVDTLFAGANPLGRRIRYIGRSREAAARHVELDRWYEIVGVVPDFPIVRTLDAERVGRVYHAAAPGDLHPMTLAVRVRADDPSTFAGTLRDVTAGVNPNLQLRDLSTAEQALKREQGVMRLIGFTLIFMMLSVVVLSSAGIYALMSFTVARRRREIGIRAALGADRNRLLAGIFSRVFGQLAIGAAIGMAGAVGIEQLLEGDAFQGQGAVILPFTALFITIVGLLAALGPARRGLRIQPTEALRDE